MSKKILLLGCLILLSYTGKAQILISLLLGDKLNSPKVEFGLDGGLNLTNIQGLSNADLRGNFNLGFYFDLKLFRNPAWSLNTGVIVKSPMGAQGLPVYSLNNTNLDSAFKGGTVNRKLRYFSVPILMKYKFGNNFFIKGGVQLALINHGTDIFINKVVDKDDLKFEVDVRNQYNPLDAGLVVGAGYRLMGGNGMNLGIQYYQGLVEIRKDQSGTTQLNSSLYFTVGIPIGKVQKAPEATK